MFQSKMNQRKLNRWLIVTGAIMIQLALGAIYAWSAFTTPLQGTATNPSQYNFTKTETQAIFSAGLATFAIVMVLAGRLQQRIAPRTVAFLGGILLGAGYISASFVGASFIGKLLTIGIIGGAGIGLAYVVPIAVGVKWFPDRKGLLTGLAVAGFGFGALIWILLAKPPAILGISGLIQTKNGMFTLANVDWVFMIYGVIFLVLVVLGSLVMINPPEGYQPPGWTPPGPKDKKGQANSGRDCPTKKMLKTWQFYAIWSMFLFGALAGLMVIGNIQNFAKDPREGFLSHGFVAEQATDFAVIGAAICLPMFNGVGRIVWGIASDKIGRRKAMFLMFLIQGVMMLALLFTTVSEYLFYIVAALIGFNFGGNFTLFPATTADFYGNKNLGSNYGLVFTSYGVGGIAGPVLAGIVQDSGLSFLYAFIPAAVLCFAAAVLAFFIATPEA